MVVSVKVQSVKPSKGRLAWAGQLAGQLAVQLAVHLAVQLAVQRAVQRAVQQDVKRARSGATEFSSRMIGPAPQPVSWPCS